MAKASVSLRQVSSDLESHDRLNENKRMDKYAGVCPVPSNSNAERIKSNPAGEATRLGRVEL
jgi:hypothetical protein